MQKYTREEVQEAKEQFSQTAEAFPQQFDDLFGTLCSEHQVGLTECLEAVGIVVGLQESQITVKVAQANAYAAFGSDGAYDASLHADYAAAIQKEVANLKIFLLSVDDMHGTCRKMFAK